MSDQSAIHAVRSRAKAILTHAEAKHCRSLALSLALDTNHSIDEAVQVMASMPKPTTTEQGEHHE